MIKRIFIFLWRHKIISLIILAVIIASSYFSYQKVNNRENGVDYRAEAVKKGMLISSISGIGQVSASSQVELKPKVSGDIVSVNVIAGQVIKRGNLIVQIDARDAARKVNEARSSLENAKLDLEELLAPVDNLTLIQAENSLADTEDSLTKLKTAQINNYQETIEAKQKAEDNLEKAYEDAYNDIADAFLDLPDIITGLYIVLFSDEISDSEVSVNQNSNNNALINSFSPSDYEKRNNLEKYLDSAEDDYRTAKKDYNDNFDGYKDTSRYSEKVVIENFLEQTLETTKKIADAVKSEINMLDLWAEYRTDKDFRIYNTVFNYQSDLDSYTSQTSSHLSSLLSAQRSIEDYKEDILEAQRDLEEMEQNHPLELAQAERNIKEKQEKVNDLKQGATKLEIKGKQLTVQQRQNSLIEAQAGYVDHFIRSPFSGTVAEINVVKGDNVSGSTVVATLISDQKIAAITLNEIDIAQVKTGQKATLEFDAVENLSITGEVVEVDILGAVNQGVVSYDIKIGFDVQDERIKPGMSVSTSVILESKLNVLLAPISAVKTMGKNSYVQILVDGQLQRKTVVTGLSNDVMIEIVEGLEDGEEIITQTMNNGSTLDTSGQNTQGSNPMRGMYRISH